VTLILTFLATLRLTRFVTTDYLGHWMIVQPARRWALWEFHQVRHAPAEVIDEEWNQAEVFVTKRQKLVKGLDCPFCVGFWIGAAVLLSLAIARAVPPLLPVWRFVMSALALNYVTAHISARVD
jgi:hypothetical protein